MNEILFQYQKINPMNWVYLSSLLTIGLYFKFSRFWSVRNVDLIGLILFAPGLVMVAFGRNPPMEMAAESAVATEQAGFVWLFVVGGLFLIRMLMDSAMVRRPLLEPNLSVGGMTFMGVSLLVFLMANVANSPATVVVSQFDEEAAKAGDDNPSDSKQQSLEEISGLARYGPRNPLLGLLPTISTQTFFSSPNSEPPPDVITAHDSRVMAAAKSIAILSHLAIVIGMIVIGYQHFDNVKTGVAAAVLYLLLPYTAEMTGSVDHSLPAAILVWSIVMYRRPLLAGLCLGLACGVIYYPLFLLPLWISFYWQRRLTAFLYRRVIGIAVLSGCAGDLCLHAAGRCVFDGVLQRCSTNVGPRGAQVQIS